jgi:membrane-bound ClpP family serine protease
MEGIAVSDIKPYGKAEFMEKVFEVKSSVGFISVGTSIKITKLENNLITVKP